MKPGWDMFEPSTPIALDPDSIAATASWNAVNIERVRAVRERDPSPGVEREPERFSSGLSSVVDPALCGGLGRAGRPDAEGNVRICAADQWVRSGGADGRTRSGWLTCRTRGPQMNDHESGSGLSTGMMGNATRRWYFWLVAAVVLFGIGVGALVVLGDGKTASGEDDTSLLNGVAWLAWLVSWGGALISVGLGLAAVVRRRTSVRG
jgi:hypothetical protein